MFLVLKPYFVKSYASLRNFMVFCGIIVSEDEASKGTIEREGKSLLWSGCQYQQ